MWERKSRAQVEHVGLYQRRDTSPSLRPEEIGNVSVDVPKFGMKGERKAEMRWT